MWIEFLTGAGCLTCEYLFLPLIVEGIFLVFFKTALYIMYVNNFSTGVCLAHLLYIASTAFLPLGQKTEVKVPHQDLGSDPMLILECNTRRAALLGVVLWLRC